MASCGSAPLTNRARRRAAEQIVWSLSQAISRAVDVEKHAPDERRRPRRVDSVLGSKARAVSITGLAAFEAKIEEANLSDDKLSTNMADGTIPGPSQAQPTSNDVRLREPQECGLNFSFTQDTAAESSLFADATSGYRARR